MTLPNMLPAKPAVYIRTKGRNEMSAAKQLECAKAYCRDHLQNINLQVYCDEGGPEVPALERLVADANSGTVDLILVDSLDRFGRRSSTLLDVMSRMERSEVKLLCTAEEDAGWHPEVSPDFDKACREAHAKRAQLGKQEARSLASRRLASGGQ